MFAFLSFVLIFFILCTQNLFSKTSDAGNDAIGQNHKEDHSILHFNMLHQSLVLANYVITFFKPADSIARNNFIKFLNQILFYIFIFYFTKILIVNIRMYIHP